MKLTEQCKRCGGTGERLKGEFLKQFREGAGKKQSDIAEQLHVTVSYISDIENGRRDLPYHIEQIYRKLGGIDK